MSAANKIAQELTAIPQEFQDKAIEATLRSQFWEIIDCPVTLDLALAFCKAGWRRSYLSITEMRACAGIKNARSKGVPISAGDL